MKKLVIDVQTLQAGSRFRGIGRATVEIISSITHLNDTDLEVSALFDASREFPCEIRKKMESQGIEFVPFYPYENSNESVKDCVDISEKIKAMVVKSINPDMYIGPHVFEGYEDPIYAQPISGIMSVCIFYDAIPLQYPEIYLRDVQLKDWYFSRIKILESYDVIFTLSESSREEARNIMQIDSRIVKYIGGGFSRRVATKNNSSQIVNEPTFLYFGAFDARKNVKLIIESFAALHKSKDFNARLILAGHVQDYSIEILPLMNLAKSLGIHDKIDFRGYVSELEIEQLFSQADVFIQASIAEGLGLGLLDAVAHGIPAIACDIPSAREVLGDTRYLFQNNIFSLSEMMSNLTFDEDLRAEFSSSQLKHAEKLTWDLAAMRMLVDLPRRTNSRKTNPLSDARKNYFDLLAEVSEFNDLANLELDLLSEVIAINFSSVSRCLSLQKRVSAENSYPLLIEGHFEGTYSLSILNREFTSAIQSVYPEVEHREISFHSTEMGFFGNSSDKRSSLNTNAIVSRNAYPPLAHDMQGTWNFFHCFNWEETEFPAEYVMEFNHFLDGVTCASTEVQKSLIDSGVRIPTRVVSLARTNSSGGSVASTSAKPGFNFLHISSGFPRKGVDVLVKAFEEEFSQIPDAFLTIKTFPNPHQNIEEIISEVASLKTRARIQLIEEDYTEDQIQDLYRKADCLVQPSRGEGFGLPIFEAMSAGLKVIATKWGGHMDFYLDADKYGVTYQMEPSNSHVSVGKSLWAEPSLQDLRIKMKNIYMEGKYPKKNTFNSNTWSGSAHKHLDFMSEVMKRDSISPNIAWLSSWDTKCGIAEYSFDLVRHFDVKNVKVFAPYDENPLLKNREIDFVRCWSPGIGSTHVLMEELDKFTPSIVVIQFNLGFFSLGQVKELLASTNQLKRIVEIHSLRNHLGQPHRNILELTPEFLDVDRLLVHNIDDYRFLHEQGLGHKAVLFPHPIPNFGHKISHKIVDSGKIVIGTSGFALPHKGLIQLILAVNELVRSGHSVELKLFTPEHPDPSSREHLIEVYKQIDKMKNLSIHLDETFHEEENLISLLSSCDLRVYAHQVTGEAASGTVHHGLASGRPVLVTPSSIFQDSSECLYFTDGFGATDIAKSISLLISDLKGKGYGEEKEIAVKQKLITESFAASAARLEGMGIGILNSLD